MENSVRDLWSLMNFVAPGYLGSRNDFRERYEKPLTEGRASAARIPLCNVGSLADCGRFCSVAASPMSRASCRRKSSRCSRANLVRRSARPTTRSCARFSRGSARAARTTGPFALRSPARVAGAEIARGGGRACFRKPPTTRPIAPRGDRSAAPACLKALARAGLHQGAYASRS